jgi:hypothetical protein
VSVDVRFRHTAVLMAVFAALLAYFLLVDGRKDADPNGGDQQMRKAVALFDYSGADVTEVEWSDGPRRTVIRRADGNSPWELAEPSRGKAQDDRVNFAVKTFASLKAERVITDTEVLNHLADYGLQPPHATAVMKLRDGRSFTLYVGDETPDLTNRYVQLKGEEDKVYLVGILLPNYVLDFVAKPPFLPAPTPGASGRP